MRIRRLRLAGFKSFVEPAELRIEPGLTGVVGPNGCGKSNLLEAMRWAMGEGSPKSLRGGGMEDVIFAGTTRRPARDFAEVSILLDDGDGAEREVVRRIERGAGSAYRLDGRDVRQRDVALLFADAATGAHSPALVSQGRIAAVISARPAERRQMLEEAAGIAGLHVRRKDAEQRLRATEANLETLDGLLREMAARGQALARQARQAERYRQLSDAIRLAEARMIFSRWRDAAAAADAARVEMARAEAEVAAASGAQRDAASAQAAAVAALADARAAAQRAVEAAAETARRRATLVGERAAVVRRLADLSRQADAIAGDRAREDRLAIDAADALGRLVEEEKALAARLARDQPERAPLEARVRDAERAAHAAELALERALAQVAAERADARIAAAALDEARRGLARAQAEAERLLRERAALPDVAALEAARTMATRTLAEAIEAGAAARRAIEEAEQARAAATDRRAAAQREQATAQAALAAIESERRSLDQSEARAKGGGVLARLSVTPGHERALAAALGGDLDAGVGGEGARRWAGAALGRDDPALPAGLRPLADEVAAPAELDRRLRQVGVVERDDGTIALAVGQRLVTLAGGLRRWDGFVSRDPDAAAAERLVRANRLAEVERALAPLRGEVERAASALGEATARVATSEAAIAGARGALAANEERERSALRAEDAAGGAVERARAQARAIEHRAAPVEAELARARDAVVAAEAAAVALPAIDATEAETARLRAESGAAQAALAEARARLSVHERELAEARRRLEAVRAEARGWRARAGDAAGRVKEMAERADAIELERASLSERPAVLDGEIAAGEADERGAAGHAAAARTAEAAGEAALRACEAAVAAAAESLATAREARAGAAARADAQELRRVEMGRIAGERFQCPAPVLPERLGFASAAVGDAAAEAREHERLTGERERIGPVNLVAADELAALEAERAAGDAERQELGEAVNRLRGSIGSLNREGRQRLQAAFAAVDGHFRRLFTSLFAGGEAHLALVDSDDPLEAGLEIMAQPPGKKLATLTLLSGGEQALTAVALIFALFLTNPAPICVLDEVDAPLDDANIERFCDLLARMTGETDTRYLIVTHNPVTMSRMDRLFGVTMVEQGVSRLVSVDLGSAEALLAAE